MKSRQNRCRQLQFANFLLILRKLGRRSLRFVCGSLAIALLFLHPHFTPRAFAEGALNERPALSAEQLDQFVKAYLQVFELIDHRQSELQAAETESESLQIQREIEQEAFNQIAAAGLTRQEYLQILGLANADPEVGEQIAAQIQEAAN